MVKRVCQTGFVRYIVRFDTGLSQNFNKKLKDTTSVYKRKSLFVPKRNISGYSIHIRYTCTGYNGKTIHWLSDHFSPVLTPILGWVYACIYGWLSIIPLIFVLVQLCIYIYMPWLVDVFHLCGPGERCIDWYRNNIIVGCVIIWL